MQTPSNDETWLESPQGQRWLVGTACALGRAPGNQILLEDANVSRRHALVHCQNGKEHWLVDLGSSNGTYLNGRRVVKPTRLKSQDCVRIGEREFVFHRAPLVAGATSLCAPPATMQQIKTAEYWMFLLDLVDSSRLGQALAPKELSMLTGRWLGACKDIIESHGGCINKYLGDGLLAYWAANEKPEMVVRMLSELRQLQDRDNPRFRCVFHVGELAVGGTSSQGEESLVGRELNLVFRLEKLAGDLGALRLMSGVAAARLRHLVQTKPAGSHPVKGFDRPVAVFVY
jgi:adenylate cyclase